MCLGWQVPRAVLPHWAGWSSSPKIVTCGWVNGAAETELQPAENPSTAAGGCPKEAMMPWRLCWNRLLAEPAVQWKEESTLEQVCWKNLKQAVPEGLTPRKGLSGAAVHEELQAVGRKHTGEVQGGLCLWVGPYARAGRVWDCHAGCGEGCRTQPDSVLVSNSSIHHTTSPVLSDHHERWSPKSQTKRSQWTSVDNLQAWCTEDRNDIYILEQRMGWWWLRRLYWRVCNLSIM